MMRNDTTNFWNAAKQFLVGGIASGVVVTFSTWRRRASRCVGGRQQSHYCQSGRARGMIKSDLNKSRSKAFRISYYAMAVLSVAIATIVAAITARLLQAEPIALLMLCAVSSAAWLGGLGPAILAIALGLF